MLPLQGFGAYSFWKDAEDRTKVFLIAILACTITSISIVIKMMIS